MSPWFSDALLRTQTDERLVALARDGHERAFVAIVERYRRPLLAFTRGLVPEARAEDVLQQALLSAWAALGRGAEVRHLRGWLHQIVRNAAMAARAPGEEPLPDAMIDNRDTPSRVEERLLIAQTLENLAALPDHQRQAIVKTAMEGRSREEVASSLGVTEGAVRAMLHRARVTLRAAATAVTPLPLAVWAAGAAGAADRGAEIAAGGGAAGLAAAAAKAGTVVAVTGAVATTVATDRLPLVQHHRTPTQAPTAPPRDRHEVVASSVPRAASAVPVRAVNARPARQASRPAAVVVRPVARKVASTPATTPTTTGSRPRVTAPPRSTHKAAPSADDHETTKPQPAHTVEADSSDESPPAIAADAEGDDNSSDTEARTHSADDGEPASPPVTTQDSHDE